MNWNKIGSGNGLSPVRRQAITWINTDLLSIEPYEQISVKFESMSRLTFTGRFNSLRPGYAYMRRILSTIGSDNGLLPGRRQAIIWTSAEILLIGPLGTNFNQILI